MSYNYKIIDFLATRNVIEVCNKKEFDELYALFKKMGLENIFPYSTFEEWLVLARINNKNLKFYFEYDNSRGLTWYDNAKEPTDWYGVLPLKVSDLKKERGQ